MAVPQFVRKWEIPALIIDKPQSRAHYSGRSPRDERCHLFATSYSKGVK